MDQPAWMVEAWRVFGTREKGGSRHSPEILAFFRDVGRGDVTRDEVPWCAAFVGACLKRGGQTGTGSLRARSFLDWGQPLSAPRLGAVAVLTRGRDPGAGHVGFWLGETATAHIVLGGNQDDAVTVDAFAKDRLLGFRWPLAASPLAANTERVPAREAEVFQELLAHVLEMEGGFTDDPDDPGGPTNKGIILAVYARHTGRPLNDATHAARVGELRDISDALVEDIYRKRYWRPSRAAEMPAAIAFMHFDASVNHGVRGAAKLLQRALKAQSPALEVDGEIGPLTMAAVTRADELRLIDDYAEARRRHYRALKHFWKFGRGWLNRVARTEARARVRLGRPPAIAQVSNKQTKGADMTTLDGTVPAPKWWGSSMTIWGAAITALSIIGPAIGVDVTPDIVRQAGEQVVAIVQAIGGLAGTLMTIYGRMRALQPLERREMQLKL